MKTSQRQTSPLGEAKSTSSQEAFLVKPLAWQGKDLEIKTTVTSGRRCYGRYGRYSPLGSLVKTLLECERTSDVRNGCKNGLVADTLRTGRQELDVAAEPREALLADSEGDAGGLTPHPDEHGHTPRKACNGAEGSRRRDIPQPGERRDEAERPDGLSGLQRVALDTECEGLERRARTGLQGRENGLADAGLPSDRWADFPTQSPVCSRHDGVSLGLVGITFPRWRAEAVKALGNAMVPQVIYEIFRAIEKVENDEDADI